MEDSTPLGLDHFRAYNLVAHSVDHVVGLRGQFDDGFRKHRLVSLEHFSNPVDKNKEGILDRYAHLNWYALAPTSEPGRVVRLANQFGVQKLAIGDPDLLLVPTEKLEKGSLPPKHLDHFKCYRVMEGVTPEGGPLTLKDQFFESTNVRLMRPLFFCVPVAKRYKELEEIKNEEAHLTIYRIGAREHGTKRKVRDQFDTYGLSISSTAMLAVPSRKLEWSKA